MDTSGYEIYSIQARFIDSTFTHYHLSLSLQLMRLGRTSESKSLNFIVCGNSYNDTLTAYIISTILICCNAIIQCAACDITPCCKLVSYELQQ